LYEESQHKKSTWFVLAVSMKILICNYEYPPIGGGGGITTQRLAEELVKRHFVTVITSAFRELPKHEIQNGVEIHRVPVFHRKNAETATLLSMASYFPSSLLKGVALCRKEKFDVINSHFAVPTGPSAVILSKVFRIPHVLSIHGGDVFDPSKSLSPHKSWGLHGLVQSIINSSDMVLPQSSNIEQNTRKYYRIRKPIRIIPHAIKRPAFEVCERQVFGFSTDDILLITIGRLIHRKAIHHLITMVSRINDPKVKLLILGDGPERQSLEGYVARLGLTQRVFFSGWVAEEQKFQLLNTSNVYVSSTLHEGFGLIFCEAMACGLPIVTFDNGGHTDFLVDGRSGFLVPAGDLDTLRERVEILAYQPDLRSRFGSFNKGLVENFFIERCASEYEEMFAELSVRSTLARTARAGETSIEAVKGIYGGSDSRGRFRH
jgi:glycosyltransferase involved in cell wall biosynthesis